MKKGIRRSRLAATIFARSLSCGPWAQESQLAWSILTPTRICTIAFTVASNTPMGRLLGAQLKRVFLIRPHHPIGLRGSMNDLDDFDYGDKMGVRLMRIEEAKGLGPTKGDGNSPPGGRRRRKPI